MPLIYTCEAAQRKDFSHSFTEVSRSSLPTTEGFTKEFKGFLSKKFKKLLKIHHIKDFLQSSNLKLVIVHYFEHNAKLLS